MRALAILFVMACVDANEPTPEPSCAPVPHRTTFVESNVFGPSPGTFIDVPITPTTGGELLVVTIVTPQLLFTRPTMIGGRSAWQVGVPGDELCGRYSMVWTIGDVEPGASNIRIEGAQASTTFTVSVARFTGLSPESGATATSNYGFGTDELPACAGSLLISAARSCGALSLATESPFTPLDSLDGVSTAYLVPTSHGSYAADWVANDIVASGIFHVE